MEKVDNKKLVKLVQLPDNEQVEEATTSEIVELKKVLDRYTELLARIVRDRVN